MSTERDWPAPRGWARTTVHLLTLVLPDAGGIRERYRREVAAELWGLSRWRQLTLVLGFASRILALRAAWWRVSYHAPHTRQWCWLRLHHTWRWSRTEDNQRFRHCVACGIDEDGSLRSTGLDGYLASLTVH